MLFEGGSSLVGVLIPSAKTTWHICHASALLLNAAKHNSRQGIVPKARFKAQRLESFAKETGACCIFFATLCALGIFAFNFHQKVFVDGVKG